MAGSFHHIVNANLDFLGVDLIDNLGDAFEALEECYDMLMYLSGGDKAKLHEAWLNGHIRRRAGNDIVEKHPEQYTFDSYWKNMD